MLVKKIYLNIVNRFSYDPAGKRDNLAARAKPMFIALSVLSISSVVWENDCFLWREQRQEVPASRFKKLPRAGKACQHPFQSV